MTKKDLVSVCICTYKRPLMLARALDRLQSQTMEPSFIFDVVITDNDVDRSAHPIAIQHQERGALKIVYDVEPIQSIALARNRSTPSR